MNGTNLGDIEATWWNSRIFPLVKMVGCFACAVTSAGINDVYYKNFGRPVFVKRIKNLGNIPVKIAERGYDGEFQLTPKIVLAMIPAEVKRHPEIDAYYVKIGKKNQNGTYDAEISFYTLKRSSKEICPPPEKNINLNELASGGKAQQSKKSVKEKSRN